jgi:crotonobetainyl-CoA:carnitine CoA-transferase CaiB-like acyl-CoA transferase/enoyl-CoA hydratase/carnithine racemase
MSDAQLGRGSLHGLRVVDLTMSVAGPFATQILGDLGADVVKVERPPGGDDTRRWGPPFWGADSALFQGLNRNKRSLLLDLKSPDGGELMTGLLAGADVLVQNLRPGALARLGFGYEQVRAVNPRLVYCEISGYGPTGPLADRPAYDPLMQAFSGLMSLNGEDGGAPARIPSSILDQGSAMWAVIGILDALRRRERTGRGALVQTSLLQTALMWMPTQWMGYFAAGVVPPRLGSGTVGLAPYQAFQTADGWIIVAAGNENLWRRLCAAIARPELLTDPRFVTNPDRVEHRHELAGTLTQTFTGQPSAHWQALLQAAGVPVTPIQTMTEVAGHEQVAAVRGFQPVPHPELDGFRVVNTPVQIDGQFYPIRLAPPRLGEGGDEVQAELAARPVPARSGRAGRVTSPGVEIMRPDEVLFDVREHVGYITLNRPERRNALSQAVMARLADLFSACDRDPEVRAVVITGTGDRAFCAGADLKELDELARAGEPFPVPMTGPGRNVHEALLELYKPTIAALNGPALAGGFELAIAADLRIAAAGISLGLPEAKRGMGANFASVVLPRLVPRAVALELLYTGDPVTAERALELGLVNQVVPAAELGQATEALVRRIVANAPLSLRRYSEMATKGWELPVPAALRLNAGPNPYLSADREEGVRAFVEKRPPRWQGR